MLAGTNRSLGTVVCSSSSSACEQMPSLGDPMDSPLRETAGHSISTTPVASGTAAMLPPRNNRSTAWDHFTVESGVEKKARCNYCGGIIKYKDGTSGMKNHLKRCKWNPYKDGNKRQRTNGSSSQAVEGKVGGGVGSSPTYFKFDQELCRTELVKMFVVAELPFRFVENEVFCKFLAVLQPRFSVPSHSTLTRDIYTLFNVEKERLKKFLGKHCGRVCLTTDTWTSIQNLTYMSLTAHFVDNNWRLQKKILNFRQITGHSGEVMAKNVEICLDDWKLNQVFSLTVDNASSNDLGIQYLKKRMLSCNSVLLKGEYIHMRCCAHILSLIVKECMKEVDKSILKIRSAVKYIRSSPSRLAKFKACAELEKISYKGLICLDVDTRWNSTYLMLEAAVKYRKAFDLLELRDDKYVIELSVRGDGTPDESDWNFAHSLLPFLKMFYDATMRISGSYYVTSNIYMKEVFAIGRKIRQCQEHIDDRISLMATRMRTKYEKYWGTPNGINILLLIAVVLDPRCKLDYVNHFIGYLFSSDQADELKLKLTSGLKSLYEQYQGIEERSQINQEVLLDDDDDIHGMSFYYQEIGRRFDEKSELDKYLKEDAEPFNKLVEFDILNWWRVNSARFPILGSIAREVLAIPVSTVASESAFSTGGRVLDPYRSSLTPRMLEALVCTHDWLKGMLFSMLTNEDFEELGRFEQEMTSPPEGTSSMAIDLD